MMAITTSNSISVNALEDERLVFTPRNWYAERLPAWPSARNIKVVPCSLFPVPCSQFPVPSAQCSVLSARFWVSSWDRGFHGFTFKRRERGGAEGRRVKRGMILSSPSTSNLETPCSILDILSLRCRCPVIALRLSPHST